MEDRYGTVRFEIRAYLDISLAEYCFCEIVYHLSNSRKSRIPGWAYASNHYYGRLLGMTERGTRKLKARMIEIHLVERNPDNLRYIRTTLKWEEAHIEGLKKEEQSSGLPGTEFREKRNKVPGKEEQSSPYNNSNTDPYNDNDIEDSLLKIQELLKRKNLEKDTVKGRKVVHEVVMSFIDEPDFIEQWEYMNQGHPNVDRKKLIPKFIKLGHWQYVKEFRMNKMGNWIANESKNQDNGGGQSNGYEYEPGESF